MELHLLFADTIILDNNREMKLEYSLTEKSSSDDENNTCYGIQIMKFLDDIVEKEIITTISYTKENVINLLKVLFQHQITPMSLVETLDHLMTELEIYD